MNQILWLLLLRSVYGFDSKEKSLIASINLNGNVSTMELMQYALDERHSKQLLQNASQRCDLASQCVERVDYILAKRKEVRGGMEVAQKKELKREDIAREANLMEFEIFFREYAVRWTPVLLESVESAWMGNFHRETTYFMDACFPANAEVYGSIPLKSEAKECVPFLDTLHVPSFIVGNYLQQTKLSKNEVYLPRRLRRASDGELLTCSHGLHMFLTVLSGKIEVLLYPKAHRESQRSIQVAAIEAREWLFVPGFYLAAVSSSIELDLLYFCYVDASNLHSVQQELEMDAVVDSNAKELLQTLTSPDLSTFMSRCPLYAQTQWKVFTMWPRPLIPRRFKKKTAASVAPLSRRQRYRQWQYDKQWNHYIALKTLPAPNAVILSQIKRTSVIIAWQDVHQPERYNTRDFGYFVNWKKDQQHTIYRQNISTQILKENIAGKLQTAITNLQTNSTYAFSIGIYVDGTFGPKSKPSQARTLARREPNRIRGAPFPIQESRGVYVRWLNPIDDGGEPIAAFSIAIRDVYGASILADRIDVISASSVLPNGSFWMETRVENLIPGKVYQFRIAATNAFGQSAWSEVSESFQPSTQIGHIRGIPTTKFQAKNICVFVLSDQTQTISKVSSNHLSYGWRGHFSPNKFDVIGELIASEPLDASIPLQNAQNVAGRIVVLTRGQASFLDKVWHAQQAGAIGVVIIDIKGVCTDRFHGNCVVGSSKAFGNGFGYTDRHDRWYQIHIPYILITNITAASLLPECDLQMSN